MTTFGSVCSGIEAASVAWGPLGWHAAWFAEIEPFPSAVLAHHYPNVPNLGDMRAIARRVLTQEVQAPDILCGGTPCQAFSVAGLRQSLADDRGNLTLTFVGLADAIDHVRGQRGDQPSVVFWENVPGVLSTKDNAFGCFLGALVGESTALVPAGGRWTNAGAVYGPKRSAAWRVLDAQYFGVAQRRRRVFVVASARDGFDPAAVLFEFDGVRRDTAPRREAGEGAAATLDARAQGGGFPGTDGACGGHIQPVAFGGNNQSGPIDVATARNACASASGRMDFKTETFLVQPAHTLRGEGFDASEDGTGRGTPLALAYVPDVAATQVARSSRGGGQTNSPGYNADETCVAASTAVRRLMPVECERLQGFEDDYTLIPWRKKPASECPDGPRYKALGNSWAVPNVRWIGARIKREMDRTC